ncbi:exported hypothetical protein [Methylocella tundrae]|uniref:Glycoside hydrolase family 5 domain-containing protein n=1 Tax=Methylocella tundrae TaxID=227605 RepID=A0A8B6M596_METTU|nr:hypothetical protein [Methylocella tundrae]VTZ49543.1 exported hypothetical protein [Methylocella tundrae]
MSLRKALYFVAWLLAVAPQTGLAACIAPVSNPPLNAVNGVYPSLPALPWTAPSGWTQTSTSWADKGVAIKLTTGGGAPQTFIAHGVNYEPTQIGGGAGVSPSNDFFYTNGSKTWLPLWQRDIPLLQALHVNSVRTYGVWKWEPGFLSASSGADGVATFWRQVDFSVQTQDNTPFCDPGNGALTYPHPDHTHFLNKMWNNGVNPIYVWIGIALPVELFDANFDKTRKENLRQFYKYTARWLAQKYGNHPAVIGFVISNEVDNGVNTTTSNFWNTLNDFNALVKASAPTKLTMAVFHDGPNAFSTITHGQFAGKTGPQVYQLDVLGDNPYNDPALPGNQYQRFHDGFATNCTTTENQPCIKPMLLTEFGTPADTHVALADATKAYPTTWIAPNFIWSPSPPAPQCLSVGNLGPPPGSGSDGPEAEHAAHSTVAQELPADPTLAKFTMPTKLVPFFPNSGVMAGDPLAAALQATWITKFWKQAVAPHLASNGPDRDTKFLYASGGYVFEFRDEWWKGNETFPYFHSASGTISCQPGQGCGQAACANTGGANNVFPGGWGDEEWFGLTSAKVNPNRCPATNFNCPGGGGQNKYPVVNYNTGALNGGPDILKPRAAIAAICEVFSATGVCD